jgi:hypothetical protein
MPAALLAAVLPFESSAREKVAQLCKLRSASYKLAPHYGAKFAARISSMRQRMRVLNLLTWKQWNFFLRVKRCIAR